MIIKIVLITLSIIPLLCGSSTTTKKISSPRVGELQTEFKQAESKRKKEIIATLTEGGFGHIADTLLISSEQEVNGQLKHTIFESEQTVTKLKQENSDLMAQLAQEKSKHESATIAEKKRSEAFQQEIKTLQESLKASGDQKDKTITISSKELDETKQQLAQYEQKIKDLEAEKTALQEKNKSLETRAQSSEKQLKEKQLQLEASEKEKQALSLDLHKLQELMQKAEAYCSELQAKYEQLQAECAIETEEKPLTKKEQLNELDRKITALKVQLMEDAVEQRRKDYATRIVKGTSFDTAERMFQSGINSEIKKLEQQKDALRGD